MLTCYKLSCASRLPLLLLLLQFEAEVDRLALWGVNLPLAFQAQEYTADRFYRSLGLNDSEIDAYLAGPAFLPWQRMGNMQGWGGPLNPAWHAAQRALQLAILQRMREFGMTPVLAGFAGHVPRAMRTHFPGAKFTNSPDWCNFPPQCAWRGRLRVSSRALLSCLECLQPPLS